MYVCMRYWMGEMCHQRATEVFIHAAPSPGYGRVGPTDGCAGIGLYRATPRVDLPQWDHRRAPTAREPPQSARVRGVRCAERVTARRRSAHHALEIWPSPRESRALSSMGVMPRN